MGFGSVPELTAFMRSHCSDGAECSCAANIETMVEGGVPAEAILGEYNSRPSGMMVVEIIAIGDAAELSPRMGFLAAAIDMLRSKLRRSQAEDTDRDAHMGDDGRGRFDIETFLSKAGAGEPQPTTTARQKDLADA